MRRGRSPFGLQDQVSNYKRARRSSSASSHTLSSPTSPAPSTPQARSRLDDRVIESVDLIEGDEDLEEIQIIEEENQVEAELERQHAAIRRQARTRPAIPLRNPPLGPTSTLKEIESYLWNGSKLRKGKTVELKNGSFLHIDKVVDSDDDVIMIGGLEDSTVRLRGRILKRHRDISGYLAHQRNELCFVYEVDLDDKRPITEQCVVEVDLNDIKKIRKLIITNQPYPECKYDRNRLPLPHPNTLQYKFVNDQYIEDHEVLTCRWKLITYFETAAARVFPKSKASIHQPHCRVESVTEEESSVTYGISAESRRHVWRGDTTLGGSYFNRGESQYTYGDCFCGCGGMTRGAFMAGLKVKFGMDCWDVASKAWKVNFSSAKMHRMWADQFYRLSPESQEFLVDILHLSPPCQTFSPAHTREGQNDEQNSASLFAVDRLLIKTRPRVVTLEQTFGILSSEKHENYFKSLIRQFTDNGFSLEWRIVEFKRFGLAQTRKRLIIMAACPGETIPPFPEYTHSKTGGNGLKSFTKARDVISSIPRNAPNHDIAGAVSYRRYPRWGDMCPTITTGGIMIGKKQAGHPDGRLDLTIRELATLQSYPVDHVFLGTQTQNKKLIGNSVPPMLGKLFLESCKLHLWWVDRKQKRDLKLLARG